MLHHIIFIIEHQGLHHFSANKLASWNFILPDIVLDYFVNLERHPGCNRELVGEKHA
jgi:hypothetical protein